MSHILTGYGCVQWYVQWKSQDTKKAQSQSYTADFVNVMETGENVVWSDTVCVSLFAKNG